MKEFAAIVLAAGRGERLRQAGIGEGLPKVLVPIAGRPMVSYVLAAIRGAGIEDITLVVGYKADEVRKQLGSGYAYALQEQQLGSGHAVLCARDLLTNVSEHVVVLCGDSPLLSFPTIRRLMERHLRSGGAVTLLSAIVDDPSGYGRILRDRHGGIRAVVEEKGASEDIKVIREVNGGAYAFRAAWLWANIERMRVNAAGELNLTDLVEIAASDGEIVGFITCGGGEILGVNTPDQLAEVERALTPRRGGGGS